MNSNDTLSTFFLNEDWEILFQEPGIFNLPLREGMKVTIHGLRPNEYEVVDWNYHQGQSIEGGGLRIILRSTGKHIDYSLNGQTLNRS